MTGQVEQPPTPNPEGRAIIECQRRGLSIISLLDARAVSVDAWRGELLGHVRRAWGQEELFVSKIGVWQLHATRSPDVREFGLSLEHADSEDEALALALEAAP